MKMTFNKMMMVLVAAIVCVSLLIPAIAESDPVPTETPAPAATETVQPTETPAADPTETPTEEPIDQPTETPTEVPGEEVTGDPTDAPEGDPTETPTEEPTETPTEEPTETPTEEPAGEATPEPVETPVPFEGSVEIKLENEGDIYFGDTVVLRAMIYGANTDYEIRWEYLSGSEWKVIEGEDEETYDFVVTEENADREYRVVLITEA